MGINNVPLILMEINGDKLINANMISICID